MVAGGRSTNRGWLQEGVIRGSMLSKSILPSDEELGKKDDDHKPGVHAPRIPSWALFQHPIRWRRRRILIAVVGLYLVYLFVHNIPDLGSENGRNRPYGMPIVPMTTEEHTGAYDEEPSGAPPGLRVPKQGEENPHTYKGQIKFYRLAASLHGASHTNGYRTTNRNVLFAVSSLKSASTLLPMICEMSRWSRNWVHAAFMGREDIPLEDLLEINGVDKAKCPAIWHDARPDFTEYSSDERAEKSVMAAMTHIYSFLHPQVVLMDDALSEDAFFVKGIKAKTKTLEIPLLEVPKDRWENLMWLARLDAGSLKSWHLPTVDILIQVPPDSSNVLRLLKSIRTADYSGLKPPRITIELPADVDSSVKRYLENFKWPPNNDNPLAGSQITIRRRIANHRANQEESAIRFLELFYPTSTTNSHALMLSPQAQLSPQYFHYLTYTLLEYKYSAYGEDDSARVMGISLELPSVMLDGKSKLKPPGVTDMHEKEDRYKKLFPETPSAPFLWQAPNSHATLFFGDKWAELYSFLNNRVVKHFQSPRTRARPKVVSETLPSWTEYLLELMRARGYSLYYPATTSSEAFVTVHNELYRAPEEFSTLTSKDEEGAEAPPKLPGEPFLRAEEPAAAPKHPEPPTIPSSRPLHLVLPFEGDLPEIPHLPYLLYDGIMIDPGNVSTSASAYADSFRETVGGCRIPKGKHRRIEPGNTKDLFCFGDEDEDDWEDNIENVEMFEAEVVDGYEMPVASAFPTPEATAARERVVSAPTVTADLF